MFIYKKTCPRCLQEKMQCDFYKSTNMCVERHHDYMKKVRSKNKEKNALSKWAKDNPADDFSFGKFDIDDVTDPDRI